MPTVCLLSPDYRRVSLAETRRGKSLVGFRNVPSPHSIIVRSSGLILRCTSDRKKRAQREYVATKDENTILRIKSLIRAL